MRIIYKDTDFVLPRDFEATMQLNNVMLTDAGEQTLPLTLPDDADGVNLRLVGYSNRIDNSYKPIADLDVVISDGLSYKPASLGIHSANEGDGISCTLYTGTGEFYNRVGEKRMTTLNWPVMKSPTYETDRDEDRINYLISLLKTYDANNNWVLCPVATTQQYKYRIVRKTVTGDKIEDIDSVFILNWYEQYQHYVVFEDTGYDTLSALQGEYVQTIISDNALIDLGHGYGITPFLKASYVLTTLFAEYGYSFDSRDIEDEVNEFSGMFILNNVADAICTGILKYAQLVPDMTIKSFLDEIEMWFCGKFIVNETKKTVLFRYFKNLDRNVVDDISVYAAGKMKFVSAEFINKKLNINNSVKQETANNTSEYISRSHRTQVAIDAEFHVNDGPDGYPTYGLDMLMIEGIIHKNTALVIDSEAADTPDDSDNSLYFGFYNNGSIQARRTTSGNLYYVTSLPMFGTLNTKQALDDLYEAYINFYANSNVAYTEQVKFPETVLKQIDINTTHLFHNQKILIEKIEYQLGKPNDGQTLHFRTMRNYLNRS